jgi:hypothetical protein
MTITKPYLIMEKFFHTDGSVWLFELCSQHDTEIEAITELQKIIENDTESSFLIVQTKVIWTPIKG